MELFVDVIKAIETKILSGPEQKYVVFPLVQELVSSGWGLAQIAFGRSELVLPSKGRPDICVFGSREGATACDLSDVRFVIECKTPRGGRPPACGVSYLSSRRSSRGARPISLA